MKENNFHKQLVERYKSRTATDEELVVFFHLLDEGKLDEYLGEDFVIAQDGNERSEESGLEETSPPGIRRSPYKLFRRLAIAACIAGVIALGAFLLTRDKTTAKHDDLVVSPGRATPDSSTAVVQPGRNRATLTLANGTLINLDSAAAGEIADQENMRVLKTTSGSLVYERNAASAKSRNQVYNNITTPRGGEYRVRLPDGTMVWLNAASSLRYSVSSNEAQRVVDFDGEGYFEVAKNASRPFMVKMKSGVVVRVLGTNFNVHGYDGEPVQTTLLHGSVRVQSADGAAVLKPGQQAIFKTDGKLNVISHADTSQAVAWKNGLFEFNGSSISEIMNQIERWYDVDVVYAGEKADKKFVGKVSRSDNLSDVLKILTLSNIHFKVQGRQITVLPE